MKKTTMKKYKPGGNVPGQTMIRKEGANTGVPISTKSNNRGPVARTIKKVDDALEKRYPNWTKKGTMYDNAKKAVKSYIGVKRNGGAIKAKKK